MEKLTNEIYVEAPRHIGEDAEFFMQSNGAHSVTCYAHIHNAVELLYIKEGSYRVVVDGREHDVGKGDLALFCSNSIHYVFAHGCPVNEYYVIKISPSFLIEFSSRKIGAEYIMRFAMARDGQKNVWSRDELEHSEILPILRQLIREYEAPKYANEIAVRLKIMELLLAILREGERTCELPDTHKAVEIYNAMTYIRSNYAEDIDERALARRVGMSYSYFSRSFKRVLGMSCRRYLNVTRIKKAEQMLCTGSESITEIATKCGYNTPSYFIQIYRSITGKTPYQVRRENR